MRIKIIMKIWKQKMKMMKMEFRIKFLKKKLLKRMKIRKVK